MPWAPLRRSGRIKAQKKDESTSGTRQEVDVYHFNWVTHVAQLLSRFFVAMALPSTEATEFVFPRLSSSADFIFVVILLHLFYLYFSKFSLSKKHFYFLCTVQSWYSVYITHVFDGATYEIMIFFHDWLKTTKATKISEMWTKEAEKTDIVRMDVSRHLCFALFLAREETPAVFVFSIEWILLRKRSNVKSSSRLPEHQIGRAASTPESPSTTTSAFSLPKEYMCMF